jgi:integrase/recombinase XerD
VNRKLAALTSFCEFHARHGVALAGLLITMPAGRTRSSASSFKPFLHHVTKNAVSMSRVQGMHSRLPGPRRTGKWPALIQ